MINNERDKLAKESPMSFLVLKLVNATAQKKDAHMVASEILKFCESRESAAIERVLDEIEEANNYTQNTVFEVRNEEVQSAISRIRQSLRKEI